MPVRQTSINAYRTIQASGMLSKRRWEIYDVLFQHGPATATELYNKMPPSAGYRSLLARGFHTRLRELVLLGVAYEVQERICNATGVQVIEYDVTANLPAGTVKRPPERLARALERIQILESENAELRRELAAARRPHRTPVP